MTPAHAGGRVTVRRDNGDGTFSDAVGVLHRHVHGLLTIEKRTGERVTWPEAELVAHKLIIPPEHVTCDDLALEEIAALGWVAAEHERRGAWLLRASDGFTGRGNSALLLAPDPALLGLDDVVAFHRDRDLRPMVAIPLPAGATEHRGLRARGWTERHGGVVMTAHAEQLLAVVEARAGWSDTLTTTIDDELTDAWFSAYHYRGSGAPPPVAKTLMTGSESQAFVRVHDGDALVGIGRVAAGAGWSGVTAVEVAPEHRRRGIGRLVMRELVAWAVAAGTPSLYLQVAPDNVAGLALYRGLGMHEHHTYVYLVAPEQPA